MSDAFAEFLKFVGDLTRKKVVALLFALFVAGAALWFFEKQSSWLLLTKLERSQKLLTELAAIERAGNVDPEVQEISRKIKRHVNELIGTVPPIPSVATTPSNAPNAITTTAPSAASSHKSGLAAFIFGALPWLIISAGAAAGYREKPTASGAAFIGITFVSAFCGLISLLIPSTGRAWADYGVVPVFLFLMSGGAMVIVSAAATVRRASKRTVIKNNLRQLLAAFHQFALENGVSEARYDQVVGPDKIIGHLHSIAGEDYTSVPLRTDARLWTVITKDGERVELVV